jgi:hypothetical protein
LTKTDTHLRSLKGYDEPEILPSSTRQICLIGADAGHSFAVATPHRGSVRERRGQPLVPSATPSSTSASRPCGIPVVERPEARQDAGDGKAVTARRRASAGYLNYSSRSSRRKDKALTRLSPRLLRPEPVRVSPCRPRGPRLRRCASRRTCPCSSPRRARR